MANIAMIISGCGYLDGTEIFEATFTLLELDRQQAKVTIFAPEMKQTKVMNHLTNQEMSGERNVLIESARIARGKIKQLNELKVEEFDALILPGGYGAAMNLSDIGLKNEHGKVLEGLSKIIVAFHNLKKPIGAMCIAPTLVAGSLKKDNVTITLGDKNDLITKLGANEKICQASEIVVDEKNQIVTTPAFMLEAPLAEIHEGISKMVAKILEMCKK